MNVEKGPPWRLFDRYVSGSATQTERAEFEAWMQEHPSDRTLIESLQSAWTFGLGAEQRWDAKTAYLRGVQRRVRALHNHQVSMPPLDTVQAKENIRPRWRKSALLTAGSVAILMIMAAFISRTGVQSGRIDAQPSAMLVYSTGNGQRATVTLPDGSQVLLNVASQIKIPATFDGKNPVFQLSGEALFRVTHKNHVPFTVVAGASVTRVLGTQFAVRHYPSDTSAIVSVRDGKVAVQSVVLVASQQLEVLDNERTQMGPIRLGRFSFEEGVLTLPGIPLIDAIEELNRWYDADVRLGDESLKTLYIKGTFVAGSLADLTELLELTFNVRVVRHGRTLTLYSKT